MSVERGIRYFPIAFFSSVMGVSGVAISLRLIESSYEMNNIMSNFMFGIASLLFLVNAIILIYRMIRYRGDVNEDFNHPVKMNFFGTISISLLLLADLYYSIHPAFSFVIWGSGALLQGGLTLITLSKLIWVHEFTLPQFNATWFIPIVGNIVVPIAGVYHVSLMINWIFFSIGVMFSIIYFTIYINRVFFQPPMPVKLMPTHFILLAPPGIGFVSYIKLVEEVDIFAFIIYGIAFYIGLLFIVQLKRFITIPFFISWWAYLFPNAAVTNATILLYIETGHSFLQIVSILQVIGLIILTFYLIWRTVGLLRNGTLLVKEN